MAKQIIPTLFAISCYLSITDVSKVCARRRWNPRQELLEVEIETQTRASYFYCIAGGLFS
jgi:hypothetical protein